MVNVCVTNCVTVFFFIYVMQFKHEVRKIFVKSIEARNGTAERMNGEENEEMEQNIRSCLSLSLSPNTLLTSLSRASIPPPPPLPKLLESWQFRVRFHFYFSILLSCVIRQIACTATRYIWCVSNSNRMKEWTSEKPGGFFIRLVLFSAPEKVEFRVLRVHPNTFGVLVYTDAQHFEFFDFVPLFFFFFLSLFFSATFIVVSEMFVEMSRFFFCAERRRRQTYMLCLKIEC